VSSPLAIVLAPYVGASVRARGDQYFRTGRVTTVGGDRTRFVAVVRGTRPYDVSLSIDGTALVASCSCPRFASTVGACKHVWAAVLTASQARSLDVPDHLWLNAVAPRPVPTLEAVVEPWRALLARVAPDAQDAVTPQSPLGELVYVVDGPRLPPYGDLRVELLTRTRRKSGVWGRPRPARMGRQDIAALPDPRDRHLLERLCGAESSDGQSYMPRMPVPLEVVLSPVLQQDLVPAMCETGRMLLRVPGSGVTRKGEPGYVGLVWDATPATFTLRIDPSGEDYRIDGTFACGAQTVPLGDVLFVSEALVLWRPAERDALPRLSPFDSGGASRWLNELRRGGPVTVPAAGSHALAEAVAASEVSRVDCPPALRVTPRSEAPRPCVRFSIRDSERRRWATTPPDRLDADITFTYGTSEVDARASQRLVFDPATQEAWRRDLTAEHAALARLEGLGVRRLADWERGGTRFDVAASAVPAIVRTLIVEGWRVEAEGQRYVKPSAFSLEVSSGIDWFELHGSADFGDVRVDVPALLEAIRRRDTMVRLGDGTFGVLPEAWLQRVSRVAALGTVDGTGVRFDRSQGALLDAWLEDEPQIAVDEGFARMRAELAQFDRISGVEPPPGFGGVLRGYQREALGWFAFLRRFGFGGCLADEMGLGKTVMVLATLEARRLEREAAGEAPRPSLVVVPRSLVFNWTREATRFAPALRVLDFTGADRRAGTDAIDRHDLVITTYGTLRRDVPLLAERTFDYVILDEAQAIKNRASHTARAAKLLKGDHRLALTGTPVENHIGELWSLFEFLNPGMLGTLRSIGQDMAAPASEQDASLSLIARGVRPFILRRTKEQVASDLPARTEQTIFCDLEPTQRALYDQLRDHYRALLLGRVDTEGMGRTKLQVLEGLLRLRQAACHPGLIDPARAAEPSAKLDLLVPRLEELVEDGRKVLVFSQFTTLLGLLRTRLDEAGLAYEYLDGRTRDRQARVERFQGPDGPPLFLISLKAGGVGLNLTAADHVFLLDPWWNPAVEAQAIDRAHRIGQSRRVFAVRLIARDTVEEKVLELQATKRSLADAIVRAHERLIGDLRREDLELLLA
jgi:superfamily II DNA or RNA helicase